MTMIGKNLYRQDSWRYDGELIQREFLAINDKQAYEDAKSLVEENKAFYQNHVVVYRIGVEILPE